MATISDDFSTNLKAYWKMEEASGTRVDETANSHDLLDGNTVTTATGIIDEGADFAEANEEYLYLADHADFDLGSGDFAFSFWNYFDTLDSGALLRKGVYAGRSYMLYSINGASCRWIVSTSGANDVTVFSSDLTTWIVTGAWLHFVITRVSGTTKLYINGTERASGADTNTYYNDGATFTLMSNPDFNTVQGGNFAIDGKMDEMGFWKGTGLTSANVTTIYNSGSGIPYEGAATSIKTINGLATASVKSINGLAIASIKSVNGLSNTS